MNGNFINENEIKEFNVNNKCNLEIKILRYSVNIDKDDFLLIDKILK